MLRVGDRVEIINQDGHDTFSSIIGRIGEVYEIVTVGNVLYYYVGFNTRNYGLRGFEAWQLKKI